VFERSPFVGNGFNEGTGKVGKVPGVHRRFVHRSQTIF
jgi:hypothetical protein